MEKSIDSFLHALPVLLDDYCGPDSLGLSQILGGVSKLDMNYGGKADLKRDGLAFSADIDGLFGAKWQGQGYGGVSGKVNDNYYDGAGSVGAVLGVGLSPGGHFALVIRKGKLFIEFNPHLELYKEATAIYNGQIATGDDAKQLAASFDATDALDGTSIYKKSPSGASSDVQSNSISST